LPDESIVAGYCDSANLVGRIRWILVKIDLYL
jgi:hypothetical protein